VNEMIERAVRRLHALEEATSALQHLRASAVSPDGTCTAEVDLTGALVGLRLDESVTRRSPAEVGTLITTTAATAAAQCATHRARIFTALSGALTAHTG
jgi:hypothetical protein